VGQAGSKSNTGKRELGVMGQTGRWLRGSRTLYTQEELRGDSI